MATKRELIEQILELAPWADTDGLLHAQLLDLLAGIKDGTVTQPTADVPTADVPTADVPTADVPTADVPVADAPVSDAPVADAPVADAPVSDAPVAEATVAEAPVAEAPVAEAPVADRLTGTIRNTMRNPQMVGSKLLPAGATRLIEPREIMGEKNVRRFLSAIKLGMLEWID